jgi:hypothetical protein
MATDHFRYDLLVQDALRGMVRKVLGEASREGLPGDHHFLVTFRTEAPGVRLSKRMREKYPEEMTIVLQHQFWDLTVGESSFEVGLSFGNVPERLLVPFDAITSFVDPSVQFGLKFEVQDVGVEQGANDATPPAETGRGGAELHAVPREVESPREVEKKPAGEARPASVPSVQGKSPAKSASKASAPASGKVPDVPVDKVDKVDEPPADAGKIISIDAFRKKT